MTSLRQRLLEDMQVRWRSPSTQERYVQAVARFARHFGCSPAHLGPEQIRASVVAGVGAPPRAAVRPTSRSPPEPTAYVVRYVGKLDKRKA